MRRIPRAVQVLPFVFAPIASADFERPQPGEVAVRAVPGEHNGQEARAIVDAPPDHVRRWLIEYEYWPGRFRDIQEARVLERGGNRARVWVRSHIMRELVLDITEQPNGVTYEAHDDNVHARGSIELTGLPDGRTDVLMATRAELSGLLGAVTPGSVLRSRERDKLTSDLTDLQRLARAHHTSHAPPSPAEAARR